MGEEEMAASFNWNQLAETLKWPAVIIIIILLFKKPLINLINRITKFGYGSSSIEASSQKKAGESIPQEVSLIDSLVGLFRQETIESFKSIVVRESEIKKLDTPEEQIDRLTNYSCLLCIMRRFDLIYLNIFGSQIRLLHHINSHTHQSRESVEFFYEAAKKIHPNYYDSYSYDDYLDFLFAYTLIREDDGILQITILGMDFLKYLTEAKKDVNKSY